MKSYQKLGLIVLGAFLLRLFCLTFVQHPGIGDPNHYYNMGVRLTQGQGFTIDYIWNYKQPPANVVHPDDYWMPLTSIVAAVPMMLFGVSVHNALISFMIIGSLIPVLAYAIARQFDCSENASLFVAAAAAALPELVLASVRTDTSIVNALFVCLCIYFMTRAFQRGGLLNFILSGAAGSLAYLTRNESSLLLPVAMVTFLVYLYRGNLRLSWRLCLNVAVMLVVAVIVYLPWFIRNERDLGTGTLPGLSSMMFYIDVKDDFAYNRQFTLETMLASRTIPQLIGQRLFEFAATLKEMYTTLDVFLPIAVLGGLMLILLSRDRQRLLTLAPTLIWIVALLVAYPFLNPIKSQGGSFKRAYVSNLPLLLPLAGYALDRVITEKRLQVGVMILAIFFTAMNAEEFVRADARFTNSYLAGMQDVAAVVKTLPDTNGDGQITLMAQDPFMLGFVGVRSVLMPFEDRPTILQVANRYQVDYILMPADRPSLDDIYWGQETDPHFIPAGDVRETTFKLFRLNFDGG